MGYNNSLKHHGVLGMKWGIRKKRDSGGSSSKGPGVIERHMAKRRYKKELRKGQREIYKKLGKYYWESNAEANAKVSKKYKKDYKDLMEGNEMSFERADKVLSAIDHYQRQIYNKKNRNF